MTARVIVAAGIAAAVLLVLAEPVAASAHVTVTPSSTAAGSDSVLTFAFGHGCDGSPTTALTIDLPESIMAAAPTLHPNWTVERVEDDDRIARVVYTAITPVEEGIRATVELAVVLPLDAAGETLVFPVLQTCAEGELNWDQLAEEGAAEPEHPAPTILVTAATAETQGPATTTEAATATPDAAAPGSDPVARVLGIGGLVAGIVGIVLALAARRPRPNTRPQRPE
ncbi:YcnI family protein [Agromyces albus]|uniref:DUF1775 domain-containing protein n=1 Tax=Agromyces albus TaxID=205332 RepID=A0A4Q2L6C3_9MICO|nr:YcnI family protein [Agromyces albus]RXZ73137.1 DUF1775 domain-containing protein [Agromyces albus]